jgi:hypothetical protein
MNRTGIEYLIILAAVWGVLLISSMVTNHHHNKARYERGVIITQATMWESAIKEAR